MMLVVSTGPSYDRPRDRNISTSFARMISRSR